MYAIWWILLLKPVSSCFFYMEVTLNSQELLICSPAGIHLLVTLQY